MGLSIWRGSLRRQSTGRASLMWCISPLLISTAVLLSQPGTAKSASELEEYWTTWEFSSAYIHDMTTAPYYHDVVANTIPDEFNSNTSFTFSPEESWTTCTSGGSSAWYFTLGRVIYYSKKEAFERHARVVHYFLSDDCIDHVKCERQDGSKVCDRESRKAEHARVVFNTRYLDNGNGIDPRNTGLHESMHVIGAAHTPKYTPSIWSFVDCYLTSTVVAQDYCQNYPVSLTALDIDYVNKNY